MELLRLLSASQIVAQIVTFMLLLYVLRLLAWKPLLKLLDDRRARIAEEIDEIEKSKLRAAQLKSEYEQKLSDIEHTVMLRMDEFKKESAKLIEDAKRSAHQEAQRIIEGAKKDIQFEVHKARLTLKNRMVELTMKATENLIQEKVDDEKDRRIVQDFLEEIDRMV
jgi:F-type H+-transporting ATPase subunit b